MRCFRSARDILVGIGIILGVVLLAACIPRLLAGAVIIGFLGLFLYVLVRALWDGKISVNSKYKTTTYFRRTNPFAFWFYACLIVVILFTIWQVILRGGTQGR
jgi:hypothetical protein